ncbi:macrolide 2'-phosphotransferase [Pseudactinotalea suaedae]|uniref:macrolide 2'-phosphotransferase n=1 Tax=Pseudactinotalea suaedae TaxID=1524924 RepID=UPI0012E24AAB|nr:macrolide 2'-phosphotransferase [Pseudactinotalea suaedae]
MTTHDAASPEALATLAASHGLTIDVDSVRLNEAGLDYRVAYATAADGGAWVLRVPRRPGMAESMGREAAVLALVRRHLAVAVPDWQVAAEDLIAYPLLPGSPALTLGANGHPVFHVDAASERYAIEIGRLMAALHAIPAEEVRAAGVEVLGPEQVRAERRGEYDRVAAEFSVADHLRTRWETWLDDDSTWPSFTVFSHGELYQAHVLVDAQERVTGVLDWTTAGVEDPARDLMYQQMTAPPEVFDLTVSTYREAGARTWPGLAQHCAELSAFGPVGYGIYALTTGKPEHRDAAQALLDPQE